LEAQVAIRTDDYSDFGRATKPKIAFSWRPAKDLLVRASYAQGFRAPSLQELYLGQSTSFPSFVDSPRCAAYRNAFGGADPRATAVCGSFQIRTVAGGNPLLDAEESVSTNFGFVWEALPNLTVAVDRYSINHTQKIRRPTFAFQLANNIGIFRDPPSPLDTAANAPGQLMGFASDTRTGVLQSYFNSNRQQTNGVDLELRYRMTLGTFGRLNLTSTTTYVDNFKVQTAPGLPLVETAGTNSFPRTNTVNSAQWNKGDWEAGITVRTRSKFLQVNQVSGRNVASFTTADTQVAWSGIKNLKLSFGINNIENKAPPFDDNNNEGYQNSTDSAVGRYYYGRIVWSFK
jgi:outer membrane receptor protein involved in Fe transport